MTAQNVPGQAISDGDDVALALQIVKEVFHLRFEIETMPQHQIGTCHGDNVAAGLTVGMWVNPGTHQPFDLDLVPANLARGIRDHASCGNDFHWLLRHRLSPDQREKQ